MTDDDEMSVGEIRRKLMELKSDMAEFRTEVRTRHHNLAAQIQNSLGPAAVLGVRVDNVEKDLNETYVRVRDCEKGISQSNIRSAYIAGGIATAISIAQMLLDLLKH